MKFTRMFWLLFIITFVDGIALFLLKEQAQTAGLLAFAAAHLYLRSMNKKIS